MKDVPDLSGLISATFTPMKADGSIHLQIIPDYIDYLVEQGIKGIFVCGSTGEGPSLTTAERIQVAEAFVQHAKGRLFTFIHVGHNSLQDAAHLAQHAADIGADAISATPPSYYKIRQPETLIACLSLIAEAAPSMPFYYYHIPPLTGVDFDMYTFLKQAKSYLPTLRGIKYTDYRLDTFQRCLNTDTYQLLYGRDELFLSALSVGTQAFIGSTYNFAAPLYRQLKQAFEAGAREQAEALQLKVGEMVDIISRFGGMAPQKKIMQLLGMDCGPVRLPLTSLGAEPEIQMKRELEAIGFFQWNSKNQEGISDT